MEVLLLSITKHYFWQNMPSKYCTPMKAPIWCKSLHSPTGQGLMEIQTSYLTSTQTLSELMNCLGVTFVILPYENIKTRRIVLSVFRQHVLQLDLDSEKSQSILLEVGISCFCNGMFHFLRYLRIFHLPFFLSVLSSRKRVSFQMETSILGELPKSVGQFVWLFSFCFVLVTGQSKWLIAKNIERNMIDTPSR